jgi:hypothetical protein
MVLQINPEMLVSPLEIRIWCLEIRILRPEPRILRAQFRLSSLEIRIFLFEFLKVLLEHSNLSVLQLNLVGLLLCRLVQDVVKCLVRILSFYEPFEV